MSMSIEYCAFLFVISDSVKAVFIIRRFKYREKKKDFVHRMSRMMSVSHVTSYVNRPGLRVHWQLYMCVCMWSSWKTESCEKKKAPLFSGLLKIFMHSVCIVTKGHWNACVEAQKKCYCVLCGDFKAYIPVGVKSLCNCLFTTFLLNIR